MSDQMWYYAINGQQWGPIAEDTLLELLRSGKLSPDTLVWKQGMTDWKPYLMVPEFQSCGALTSAPPNVPTPCRANPYGAGPYGQNSQGKNPVTLSYAGFWKRVAASLIDFAILFPAGFIIGIFFGFIYVTVFGTQEGLQASATIFGWICNWLYMVLMESSSLQATVGKMALGIKVTDMYGHRVSFGRATGRHFSKILSGLIFCVGYMMAGFTNKKQALHDMIAGCLVVNKR